eukprot:2994504-Rhodomonas_salina.1
MRVVDERRWIEGGQNEIGEERKLREDRGKDNRRFESRVTRQNQRDRKERFHDLLRVSLVGK